MEKALAEHVACHPEDAGRTVRDFRWIVWEIVVLHEFREPRPGSLPARWRGLTWCPRGQGERRRGMIEK